MNALRFFFSLIPLNKGKQTLANYIFQKMKNKKTVEVKKANVRFLLNLKDRIQAIFYLTGLYEPMTLKAAVKAASDTEGNWPVIFDVGANVGLISLQIKNEIPAAEIHMFEADPGVYSQLKRNIDLNKNLQGLFPNQNAVSEKHGETLSFVKSHSESESGWGRIQNSENQSGQKFEVQTVTLDEYAAQNSIRRIDLLKIDVEGAEELVLKGASHLLRVKAIKTLICEINNDALAAFSTNPQRITNLLKDFGYRSVAQAEMNLVFEKS